ncbi:hypothetical protein EV426DRAFT_620739 [Tirmania nivea]|nr:hypothetical protein EV426DRAFT_620739 [Tirmania nivea]
MCFAPLFCIYYSIASLIFFFSFSLLYPHFHRYSYILASTHSRFQTSSLPHIFLLLHILAPSLFCPIFLVACEFNT